MNDAPTCKTCVHCRAGWFNRALNLHSILWECDRVMITGSRNLVTGRVFGDTYMSCAEHRQRDCGAEARYWVPRDSKKHLFTLLKRI